MGHHTESSLWQVIRIHIVQPVEVEVKFKVEKFQLMMQFRFLSWVIEKQDWILGNSTRVQFCDAQWTVVNSVEVQAEKTCFDVSKDRNEYGFHTWVQGLWHNKWSILEYEKYHTHCKAKGKERLTLLIRGDRAVASWWMLMSVSIPWPTGKV